MPSSTFKCFETEFSSGVCACNAAESVLCQVKKKKKKKPIFCASNFSGKKEERGIIPNSQCKMETHG